MKKRLLSLLLVFVMVLGMLPTVAFAASDLTVADNVLTLESKQLVGSPYGGVVVDKLTIAGAAVASATQDGTTINVILKGDTQPGTGITATFGYTKSGPFNPTQSANAVTLDAEGKGTLQATLTAQYASFVGNLTYTVNFEIGAATVPAVNGETARTAEAFVGVEQSFPVSEYFEDATAYYLVDGETYTAIGETYATSWAEAGDYTLVFAAGNAAGYSENVTFSVAVKDAAAHTATVTVPEGYNPTFCEVTGIADGAAILGETLTYDAEAGTVTFPENISRIAWTLDGAVGMSAAVSNGAQLELIATTFTAKTKDGDADSAASVAVADSAGYTVSGTVADTFLLAAGSGYTYTVTPSSDYALAWKTATLSAQTVSAETATVTAEFSSKGLKSITVPKDAEVTVYYQSMYYKAIEVEPEYSVLNGDNTMTYYYPCTGETTYCKGYVYRAKLGDGILKAGYLHSVTDVTLSWDGSVSPSFRGNTNVPNYVAGNTKLYRSGDGVFMNLNATGHLVLASGSSKELGVFRTWEILDSDTTNVLIQPDFTFTRVAGNDVYSLSPIEAATAYGNNWQTLTATGSGTAFLEVSFDAVHVVNGYEAGGWGGAYGQISNYVYNASNPVQNGLIVVQTDGNAATDVSFGIAGKSKWDAETDTYYFFEDTGSLKLTPSATSGIKSVAVSNDKGNSWTTLSTDESGAYSAVIVPGNNIIRVINGNDQTAYQVVRGAKLDLTVTNLTDTEAGSSYKPGDKVRLVFDGLIAPVYKMSGIYNPGSISVKYTGTDSTSFATAGTSYYVNVPYSYNGNDYYYTSIDVTIPSDTASLTEENTYVLSGGYMSVGGYVGTGTEHRSKLSYNGVPQNTAAPESSFTRCVLDDIVLTPEIPTTSNSLPVMTGEDIFIEDMRLGEWYEVDLTAYFEDPDGDELTYYVSSDGETWSEADSNYYYYPAGAGEQVAIFLALDGAMELEEALQDEKTELLVLVANVAEAPDEVTVTFSMTQGTDKFYTAEKSDILAPREITVPYFDLSLYGLENFYYNPQCYASYTTPGQIGAGTAGTQASAEGVVTTLHVFIWATEVYQLGYDEKDAGKGYSYNAETGKIADGLIYAGGSAGSSFMNLWNTNNMNYYLNMEYPLGYPGTGSTCDQQALYDGDVISVHVIEDPMVMGSAFSALVVDDNSEYDYLSDAAAATVDQGESITLTAYHSQSDWVNFVTNYAASTDATVVYTTDFSADTSDWTELGSTDENGQIVIDTGSLRAGTYYIAVQGMVDFDASQEREMAMFTLTVEGDAAPEVTYGDLNGDGEIDTEDAGVIIDFYYGAIDLTAEQLMAADVNGDGIVDTEDAGLLIDYYYGVIESLT